MTHLQSLRDDFRQVATPDEARRCVKRRHAPWLAQADDETLVEVWNSLPLDVSADNDAQRKLLSELLACLNDLRRRRESPAATPAGAAALPALVRDDAAVGQIARRIEALYRGWGSESADRHQLLVWLAIGRRPEELRTLAELLIDDPPRDAKRVAVVIAPLVQLGDYDPQLLFPRLLDGLSHVSLASPILDLANFLTRTGQVQPHPAAPRTAELVNLLSRLASQLSELEAAAVTGESARREHGLRQVAESVSLVISLCDTLALMADHRAIEPLRAVLQLRHRRLQVEAAAALARFGDQQGIRRLAELAAEPVVRMHALAYADELGLSQRIDPRHRTDAAKAESELALWLAQPTQFGLPPRELELFDRRTQYWPGFDEPVPCFLLRFTYELADGSYSNIGIAGPLTHAFRADLTDLSPDDIYAAFAGWHAEHEDIFHQNAAQLRPRQEAELARLQRRLRDAGYRDIHPCLLGHFVGDRVLVAEARRDGRAGIALVDRDQIEWHPHVQTARPLGPEEWYSIYKGRRMLRAFND